MLELKTQRLLLRTWRDEDLAPFAEMNADPRVMEHYPAPLSSAESAEMAKGIRRRFEDFGYSLFAVELLGEAKFIGYVGLDQIRPDMPFAPAIQIGWRLAHAHWGKGYSSEAARAALTFGFETLGLEQIVAYTTPANLRSRGVMHSIGMLRILTGDFDHPALPEGHKLRRHVLYCAKRGGWN